MVKKIKSFNDLNKLQKNLKKLSNDSVPITELFTTPFLMKNTKFKSFSDFENSSIFDKYKTIEEIPDNEMDDFIKIHTRFNSWQEMINEATMSYITKNLRI